MCHRGDSSPSDATLRPITAGGNRLKFTPTMTYAAASFLSSRVAVEKTRG